VNQEEIIGPKKLTRYEKTRIIALRAQQIAAGSPLFLKDEEIPEGEVDPVKLAELELKLGRLPLLIERKKITGESQLIPVNELIEEE
jgi:DNA-directed RNA polymerase subunit K